MTWETEHTLATIFLIVGFIALMVWAVRTMLWKPPSGSITFHWTGAEDPGVFLSPGNWWPRGRPGPGDNLVFDHHAQADVPPNVDAAGYDDRVVEYGTITVQRSFDDTGFCIGGRVEP